MSLSTPLGWQFKSACTSADPEIFFAYPSETEQVEQAKAICASCPVQAQCLAYALDTAQEYGTWGGMTEWERKAAGIGRRRPHNALTYEELRHGDAQSVQWERRHGRQLCGPCLAHEKARNAARWRRWADSQKAKGLPA